MSGLIDRLLGRAKQTAGDVAGDPALKRQGALEERKGEAKDELANAEERAARKAEEIAELERDTARGNAG